MKRIIALALVFMMLMLMAACGNSSSASDNSALQSNTQDEKVSSGNENSVTVDENLLTIDITLPASFFEDEDMSTFDPDSYAEEQGFKKAALNENGSVTVTMTKAKHKELMSEMNKSAEDSYAALIQAEDTPYITDIKHSDSYDTVDIIVDSQGYEDAGLAAAFIPLTVYFPAAFYQMFAGDEQYCEISIVDAETGDTLESVVYPDAFDSVE